MAKIAHPGRKRLRNSNTRKILKLLRERRQLSKQEIARETAISIPTVTNNVTRLIEEGILEEAGLSRSTGGRKPMSIRYLPDSRYAFGVDFASNHLTASNKIRVALINLDASIKAEELFDYQDFRSVDEIMRHIRAVTDRILRSACIPAQNVLGIGISLPGTVNEKKKILELAPNLSPSLGMHNLDFGAYEGLFSLPLFVENEANAAAFAELVLGIAQDKRNLVYLSVNRGIGAGIVVRGHIYKGNMKRAGQVGHMSVDSKGVLCTCGMHDCWELYAASGALIRNYNIQSTQRITDTQGFLNKLRSLDPTAVEIWERYLDHLAVGISNLLLCYDPHYVVIGGEISQFDELLLEPLKKRVFARNKFYGSEDLEILVSSLKENAAVLGAALLPLQKLLYGNNKII
jgi:predicted NBD/HSP70 family sugar kinase